MRVFLSKAAPSFMLREMELEKSLIQRVVTKCRTRDIEALLIKWGWFTDEDLKKINFRATKRTIASQIFEICKTKGLREEIADLDLLYTQLNSSSLKWAVLKLKGSQPKTDLDPLEIEDRLLSLLEPECRGEVMPGVSGMVYVDTQPHFHKDNKHLNVKSYGGATWVRLYIKEDAPFRAADVVYLLSYPHTPILITCHMKVKMRELLYSVLLEAFHAEEIKDLQLTGHHLASLADLALQQNAQGPFTKYRDLEQEENPLLRSRAPKKTGTAQEEQPWEPRLRDENKEEKDHRQEKLDSIFGIYTQPKLEKLEYKLELRFRGTTFAPALKDREHLFRCRVKFEGPSVLEGTKNLGKTGLATLPMPKHLSRVNSLAKNHFIIAEMDSSRKTAAKDRRGS